MMTNGRPFGFTLIEAMIVVAIVAILAAVAYPSYMEHIRKGQIAEATATLAEARISIEQYFQDNNTYVGACAAGTIAPIPSPTRSFTFSCPTLGAASFVIRAQSTNTPGLGDYTFEIDQNNARRTTKFAGTATSVNCWMFKKGDTC